MSWLRCGTTGWVLCRQGPPPKQGADARLATLLQIFWVCLVACHQHMHCCQAQRRGVEVHACLESSS